MNWTSGLRGPKSEKNERRPTAQESADAMPLDEFLAAMERVGIASTNYQYGYADGFTGAWKPGRWEPDYRRGIYNGEAARKRGAHGS